jgi:ribosomal protein L11 methyltransferase
VIPPRLWQVSILTTVQGETATSELLERTFRLSPSVYSSQETGAVTVSVYPETLPASLRTLRFTLGDALERLGKSRPNLGKAKLSIKPLRRENWAESWKRHFQPIEIGKQLLIKPSWSRRRACAGQRSIILDPGLSFGTGHHPTTLFCLRELTRLRRPGVEQSILDMGCGSGILAIAAAKLGYNPVVAFDNDPEAIRSARQNIKRNKVRVMVRLADLTRLPRIPRRRYDLVCANLISDLLANEAKRVCNSLKTGGHLVVAGVLHREFPEIEKKLQGFNLTLQKTWTNKEWNSGRFASL